MLTNTEAAGLLKAFYTPLQIESMFLKDHPTLAILRKDTGRAGKTWEVPVIHEEIAGASADFTTAQAKAATSSLQSVAFSVTPTRNYLVGSVDGLTIAASRNDKGAYIKALKRTVDSCFRVLTTKMAQNLFQSQWGRLGVIGSVTGSTITLASIEDAVNFQENDDLVLSASESANALRAAGSDSAGNVGTIASIDYNTGVLTMDSTIAGIWTSKAETRL